MRQGAVVALLTLVAGGYTPREASGQELSVDVSVGRIVFHPTSTAVDSPALAARPSHLTFTVRDTRRAGSWLQASGAVPVADDALGWAAGGAGGRFVWPRGSQRRVAAGVDVSGQAYVFREPVRAAGGAGGVGDVRGVAILHAGSATVEARGGWRGHTLSYAGGSSRRAVVEAGARVIRPGALRIEAEARWVRAPEGVYPFAGATLFAYGRAPVYAWAQAGKWFGDEPFDAVGWSTGVGLLAGARTRVWVTVRQDAADPLYRNTQRRTWSIGLTRRLGGASPGRAQPVQARDAPVTIRIKVADAPPGPVAIAGAFNGWQPQPMMRDGDEWVVILTLPSGVYDYAFRAANGNWFVPVSTAGRRSDGMGGYSAVLVVP